jgi:hypothetical protein
MQDFISENMSFLRKYNGGLAALLDSSPDAEEPALEVSAAGEPTLVYKGLYVHSKQNPLREAGRLVDSIGEGGEPVVFLGFGLGYAALALAQKAPERPIIIVEKHTHLFKKALSVRDYRDFLSHRKLIIVLGGTGDGVTDALSLFKAEKPPVVLPNRALSTLDKEW